MHAWHAVHLHCPSLSSGPVHELFPVPCPYDLAIHATSVLTQVAGLLLDGRAEQLSFALPRSTSEGTADDAATKAWTQLAEAAAVIADGGSVVAECATADDAARIVAAAVRCSPDALAASAGGITLLTVCQEDRTLQQVACFNHCGHL